jgi:hypothetical protein
VVIVIVSGSVRTVVICVLTVLFCVIKLAKIMCQFYNAKP